MHSTIPYFWLFFYVVQFREGALKIFANFQSRPAFVKHKNTQDISTSMQITFSGSPNHRYVLWIV